MPPDPQTKGARKPVRIGKYDVVQHIATGGMGAVYKARDLDLDRDVALKVLPPDMAANPTALERFRREARNAAKLRHENIITIYEFGEHQGTWFLALEYVQGIDLYEYIRRKGTLDPEEARRIIIQAALALQHAYQRGIVHRDIKPSNFLVTRKNERLVIKMTDLGLSREAQSDEHRVTRSGTTVGTVDYMAPEQARDSSKADTRSDIYSLGCTFYHMLAGRPPFNEGGLTERLYKHVQDEPPDIRSFNPRVSEALLAVIGRMLAKQPADRYQTPAELVKDLLDVQAIASPVSDRDVLAGLAFGNDDSECEETERPVQVRQSSPASRSMPPTQRPPLRDETVEENVIKTKAMQIHGMPLWVIVAAAGALVLLILLAAILVLRRSGVFSEMHAPITSISVATADRSLLCPGIPLLYNRLRVTDPRAGTRDALCFAGHTPRWLGDGRGSCRIRTA
jgi:serine/threonine-protein kinase